jgi:uncharacterized protein YdaL
MRVFCIGQPKTATKSLASALEIVGLRHKSWDPKLLEDFYEGRLADIFDTINKFDSFDDLPWSHPYLFPILAKKYKGSKFILTIRDQDSWITSVKNHLAGSRTPDK